MYDPLKNLITCIKCKYVIDCNSYPEPSFCPRCGMNIINYCPECNSNGTKSSDVLELSSDDAYCYICGAKTIFHDYIIEKEH